MWQEENLAKQSLPLWGRWHAAGVTEEVQHRLILGGAPGQIGAEPLPTSLTLGHLIHFGMIATGNHGDFDSLRGAQPQRGGHWQTHRQIPICRFTFAHCVIKTSVPGLARWFFCEELGNGLPQVTKITFAMTYMDDTGRKEPGMQRMERLSPVLPLVRAHPGIRVSGGRRC